MSRDKGGMRVTCHGHGDNGGQSVVTTQLRRWDNLFRKYIISTITLHIKRSFRRSFG